MSGTGTDIYVIGIVLPFLLAVMLALIVRAHVKTRRESSRGAAAAAGSDGRARQQDGGPGDDPGRRRRDGQSPLDL